MWAEQNFGKDLTALTYRQDLLKLPCRPAAGVDCEADCFVLRALKVLVVFCLLFTLNKLPNLDCRHITSAQPWRDPQALDCTAAGLHLYQTAGRSGLPTRPLLCLA